MRRRDDLRLLSTNLGIFLGFLIFFCNSCLIIHVEASIHEYFNEAFAPKFNSFFFHGGSEGLYASKVRDNSSDSSTEAASSSSSSSFKGKSFIRSDVEICSPHFVFVLDFMLSTSHFCRNGKIRQFVTGFCLPWLALVEFSSCRHSVVRGENPRERRNWWCLYTAWAFVKKQKKRKEANNWRLELSCTIWSLYSHFVYCKIYHFLLLLLLFLFPYANKTLWDV